MLLGFVGDLIVDRADPDSAFDLVRASLAGCDVLFGNCECAYIDNGVLSPSAGSSVPAVAPTAGAAGIGNAGFDVVSLANNHICDAGHEGLAQTMATFVEMGVGTVGAGQTLTAARTPFVARRAETATAYLAYASYFPRGYEARDWWPGLAPVRSRNVYVDRLADMWAPGFTPQVDTVPVEEDYANLAADLARARAQAEFVVASFHWGNSEGPFILTDHERRTARFAIDNGADVVVGHHHHLLRGMEWYRDRPIFYGLGHFVFDFPLPTIGPPELKQYFGLVDEPGWPLLPFPPAARMTALAWVAATDGAVRSAGFLPCRLLPTGQVEPLDARSPQGRDVTDYVSQGCVTQGLKTRFAVSDDFRFEGRSSVQMLPAHGQ